jgi:hypothetical protein
LADFFAGPAYPARFSAPSDRIRNRYYQTLTLSYYH